MNEIAARFIFISPREDIRPTSHANRGGDIVPIKDHPVFPKLVHVRSHDILVAITTHRIGALVVSHQVDNIGPGSRILLCLVGQAWMSEDYEKKKIFHQNVSCLVAVSRQSAKGHFSFHVRFLPALSNRF